MVIKIKGSHLIIGLVLLGILLWAGVSLAGSPDSPGPPGSTSSYSLEDLYQRLTTGAAGSSSVFTEPTNGPGTGTMHTINEIMGAAPVLDNTDGATQAEVKTGATYWSLRDGAWGLQTGTGKIASGAATDEDVLDGVTYSNASGASTGTMPNNGAGATIVPTTTNQSIAAGYWSTANTVQGDSDLAASNIISGVNLFGVDGSLVHPATPISSAVPRTGQTNCYNAAGTVISCAGTGQDGEYQLGTNAASEPYFSTTGAYLVPTWTGERFTDNGDGTVRDNLTALTWLVDAYCFGDSTWTQALTDALTLNSGECGLSDSSIEGDWRLPNPHELHSLADISQSNPALPAGHPFSNVTLTNYYWTSTTTEASPSQAWVVLFIDGTVNYIVKSGGRAVWPVRGGQ